MVKNNKFGKEKKKFFYVPGTKKKFISDVSICTCDTFIYIFRIFLSFIFIYVDDDDDDDDPK